MPDIDSMVRVGVVSSIDADRKRARVYYPDRSNMVSGWLYVLQRSSEAWLPAINDRVLTLHPLGWNTDGYILGVIP